MTMAQPNPDDYFGAAAKPAKAGQSINPDDYFGAVPVPEVEQPGLMSRAVDAVKAFAAPVLESMSNPSPWV